LLSYSYKLVKIPSVCLSVCVSGCYQGGTNHNRCTQRLVITDLLVNCDRTSKAGQSDLVYYTGKNHPPKKSARE